MAIICDYTVAEFISFVEKIRTANKSGSDEELGELLAQFRILTGHPDGTDLIFYPEPGEDNSAEGVTRTVKEWRAAQGLPGFKGQ
ncbi:colicin immunity protein ImmE2 [Pseudomonas fluorescens HK44]|uniref:Colicin immunity protein ImmE2 n=1 Tax=Pseudomonas fluorescens HK44 TaxID=1042209 RepID=A0A010TCR0_PSEFL|nr:bacteriocin immunity protein [Pseudomonas fluorescens]EXF95062.1 colicin immunity protein ImmE2 [Pseudomonas fluorescens HK44]